MSNPFELCQGDFCHSVCEYAEFNETAARGGDHSLCPIQNLEAYKFEPAGKRLALRPCREFS
jgi:hypothetical protein